MRRYSSYAIALVASTVALVAAPAALAQTTCQDCGQVQTIRSVEEKAKTSGVGAVAGGVVGGVLGHQIGGGTGRTVATVAGAAGGAYVGNKVEQNRKTKSSWNVTIRMDNGTTRTFKYSSQPAVHEGERVRLVDGGRRLALLQ